MRERFADYRRRKHIERRKERWDLLTEEIRQTRALRRSARWRGVMLGIVLMGGVAALFYTVFLWGR